MCYDLYHLLNEKSINDGKHVFLKHWLLKIKLKLCYDLYHLLNEKSIIHGKHVFLKHWLWKKLLWSLSFIKWKINYSW